MMVTQTMVSNVSTYPGLCSRKGCSGLGIPYQHQPVPIHDADEGIQVDGTQWKGNRQCNFPDASQLPRGIQ